MKKTTKKTDEELGNKLWLELLDLEKREPERTLGITYCGCHHWHWAQRDRLRKLEKSIIKVSEKISSINYLGSEMRAYLESKVQELTAIPQEYELSAKYECHIYFIRCLDSVKIGYSKNPDMRLTALQTANPNKLELLYSFPSFQWKEKEIHQELIAHHINLEWYKYNDYVKEYIEKLKDEEK